MIEVIVFDIGGTFMQGSFIDFVNKAYTLLQIPKSFKKGSEVVFDTDYNRGRIEIEECFRKFFQVPINNEEMSKLIDLWTNTWKPTDEMIDLVESLKRNYQLAVLSNSDPVNSKKYHEKGWYSYFNPIVLSHEEGFLKPEKEIYQILLEKINLPASQLLFIDDQEEVLVTAQKLGMGTLLFKSIKELKNDLRKLNIHF
ncbi:HAD-IA family hydrolase [Candidatus Dojkabacteria bacterium]|nr:HAD-IA family hydrolase [Candidatus Dojkabacteria bacterium]